MSAYDPCAMCERFTLNRADLPPGHGWCTAWERATPWNGQIGVLFKEAKDRAPRARYVAQQQAQQQELEKA
ncbi:hypothetical protein ACFOHT_04785 [Massilia oculi]|uniref:Uncharacterized protein n=1 Tax=Massilia oculi TaxID=945844 RepID=A0A2S2DEV6_9BURK|nr:hypothetical protein [Massilia oculi]AWL03386.1 hypothetical protein DIR46_02245 [Massilia oculi]